MRAKPYLVMTHDKTGMFLWLTTKLPMKTGDVFRCNDGCAVKIRIPVSWFGGMLESGRSTIRDIEETFGDADVTPSLLLADRFNAGIEKQPEKTRIKKANKEGVIELAHALSAKG